MDEEPVGVDSSKNKWSCLLMVRNKKELIYIQYEELLYMEMTDK